MAQVVEFYRLREYGKATKLGESVLPKVKGDKKAELLAVLGASHARGGNWERAKILLGAVLQEHCGAMGKIYDKQEKLRVLAAAELAAGAAPKGDVELIRGISSKCGRDFKTDYVLARDEKGVLVGKAKMREVLVFMEAQALVALGRPEEARPLLLSLEGAKGHIVFNGKVFEMPKATALLLESLPLGTQP